MGIRNTIVPITDISTKCQVHFLPHKNFHTFGYYQINVFLSRGKKANLPRASGTQFGMGGVKTPECMCVYKQSKV